MADDIADDRLHRTLVSINVNTGTTVSLNETSEKGARALEIMYVARRPTEMCGTPYYYFTRTLSHVHLCGACPYHTGSVVLLVGTLAFDILERLTGNWSVVDQADLQSWAKAFAQPLIYDTPFLWFAFNLLLWLVLAYWMVRIMTKAGFLSQGAMVLRVTVNGKLNMVRAGSVQPLSWRCCMLNNQDTSSANTSPPSPLFHLMTRQSGTGT